MFDLLELETTTTNLPLHFNPTQLDEPRLYFLKNGILLKNESPNPIAWNFKSSASLEPFIACVFPEESASAFAKMKFQFVDDFTNDQDSEAVRTAELERLINKRKRTTEIVSWKDGTGDSMAKKMVVDFLKTHGYTTTLAAMQDEDDDEKDAVVVDDNVTVAAKKMRAIKKISVDRHPINGYPQHSPIESKKQLHENGRYSLDEELEMNGNVRDDETRAADRKKLRLQILNGNLHEAMSLITENWPSLLDMKLGLDLRVQGFVELVDKGLLHQAVKHARTELWPYLTNPKPDEKAINTVKHALGLLAYENSECLLSKTSSFHQRRRNIADKVNRKLMAINSNDVVDDELMVLPADRPALDQALFRLSELAASAKKKFGGHTKDVSFESLEM